MNFDPRPYCERLANADPKRFVFQTYPVNGGWELFDDLRSKDSDRDSVGGIDYIDGMWAFIGPLADELGVKWFDLVDSLGKAEYPGVSNTLLEAVFYAVCEKLEAVYAAKE